MAKESTGKLVGFWVLTGIIIVGQGASGVMDLTQAEPVVQGMTGLGLPLYMLTILGIWKLLGVVALAAPKFNRIREWAYAGFFFDFTGAFACHLLNGDGADLVAPPLVFTGFLLGSYALRPQARRWG